MYEIQGQDRRRKTRDSRMHIDRTFMILVAIIMYAHGISKLIIGGIIVGVIVLEYIFMLENQHINLYYQYPYSPQQKRLRAYTD